MNLSEAANRVIDLSRRIHDYYEAELPKRFPNYPLLEREEDLDIEEQMAPPEKTELQDFLATLPEETLFQLMLIRYLGRGEFGTNDLAVNYEKLKKKLDDAEHAVFDMMVFDTTVGEELSDGLEKLRKDNINVDKLPLKKAKARKR